MGIVRMIYAFQERWDLLDGCARPLSVVKDSKLRYVCALFAELAYYVIPGFEIERDSRVKVLPCLAHQALMLRGLPTAAKRAFGELELELAFVIASQQVIVVGVSLNGILFVTCRGTHQWSVNDWTIDLSARRVATQFGTFHDGFFSETFRIHDFVRKEIARLSGIAEIVFTGHSLGGAVAAILRSILKFDVPTSVCIFGTPRYCDAITHLGTWPDSIISVRRDGDFVPTVPIPGMGYADPPNVIHPDGTPYLDQTFPDVVSTLGRFAVFALEAAAPHLMEGYRFEVGSAAQAKFWSLPLAPWPPFKRRLDYDQVGTEDIIMENDLLEELKRSGQIAKLADLEALVNQFEEVLRKNGVTIKRDSALEAACLNVTSVLIKHDDPRMHDPHEDIRPIWTDVLGMWIFMQKIVRLRGNPNIRQFQPHLELLNHGTVIQNAPGKVTDQETKKIFELLFALCMLDVGTDVVLDPPNDAVGDNPDVLTSLQGRRWGFACKTVTGPSGKTLFDRIAEGVDQIEASEAEIGIVVINLRNFLDPQTYWPMLNWDDYKKGAEPIYSAYRDLDKSERPRIEKLVTKKRDDVIDEIGIEPLLKIFEGKKAVPGFLAFAQTATAKLVGGSPIPTSLITLSFASFDNDLTWKPLFDVISDAFHERAH